MMDLPILIDKDWVLKMEVFSFSSESTGGSREPNKGNLCPSGPVLHVDSDFQGRKIEHPGMLPPDFKGRKVEHPGVLLPDFKGLKIEHPGIYILYVYILCMGRM